MTKPSLIPLVRPLLAGVFVLSLSSCGDDPEQVRLREEQRSEISRLEGELAVLQEKIADLPPDRAGELGELKQRSEEQKTRALELEEEIAGLEKEKQEVERELESYRRKYVVKGN